MNLAELSGGQTARIVGVGGERSFRRRLLELGLVPGTRVEVVRVAPLGDPIELRARHTSLSIRRKEAAEVVVTLEQVPLGGAARSGTKAKAD